MITRRKTKVVRIGNIKIGGGNPIAVQSMLKVPTSNIKAAISQMHDLESAGCDIIRLAVKDNADALAVKLIKKEARAPLVADIHFNWKLAIQAIDNGIDKIRLNPGNISKPDEIREIVNACKCRGIPIRVGLNSGSLPQATSRKLQAASCSIRMVDAALHYIKLLEDQHFNNIVVSLKASNIFDTIDAYRRLSRLCSYPLHLGVTASGLASEGIIKSSIAIGGLLAEGIGDTIRVSLTATPVQEVKASQAILKALRLRPFGPEIISCPTCGRCEVDLVNLVKEFEKKLYNTDRHRGLSLQAPKVAVMGCVVNGPGEAKEADIGIAFGKEDGLLFKKGKPVRKVSLKNCVRVLMKEIVKESVVSSQ